MRGARCWPTKPSATACRGVIMPVLGRDGSGFMMRRFGKVGSRRSPGSKKGLLILLLFLTKGSSTTSENGEWLAPLAEFCRRRIPPFDHFTIAMRSVKP